MENIPFPLVSLLHSFFPSLAPFNVLCTRTDGVQVKRENFPRYGGKCFSLRCVRDLLWLKAMMWFAIYILGVARTDATASCLSNRDAPFLTWPTGRSVLQSCRFSLIRIFFIFCITLSCFLTLIKWPSLQSSRTHWMAVITTLRENVKIIGSVTAKHRKQTQFSGSPFHSKALN